MNCMRVLGVLAAWGVLGVLATMCFALGGSLGYRRGVKDTLAQIRDRRTGAAGCRPLPANHLRRRSSGHARPGARARRARWGPRHAGAPVAVPIRAVLPARSDPRVTALAATVVAVLLIGVPGAAIGATTAQPGESLYSMRRGMERVRVALATGEGDTEVHIELAAARLTDLQVLVDNDDVGPDVIADVSSDLAAHATAASGRLPRVADDTHRSSLGRKLANVGGKQVEVMDVIVARDCGGDVAGTCEARNDMLEGTVALRVSTQQDVALAQGEPQPSRSLAQADKGDRITAEAVSDGTADAGAASAQEAGATGPVEPATGATQTHASAASGPPSTAAPDDSEPAATSKAAASAKPSPAPTPTSGTTSGASAKPTASSAGSPATEPEAPAGDNGKVTSEPDAAGSGQ
jgi:hypothetical protein